MDKRHLQVGELIKRTLGCMQAEGKFDFITSDLFSINEVRTSKGYENAVVYVSAIDPSRTAAVVEALGQHAGKVRHELALSSDMRTTPLLVFKADEAEERAARIDALLEKEGA
ncbi:MAG: ribosome-binding factor A [Rickettsiales bacterium]|jgi:ribosome-binding factor A|nr:ribosome-binding factor A [Rickettsiales bacterium]